MKFHLTALQGQTTKEQTTKHDACLFTHGVQPKLSLQPLL